MCMKSTSDLLKDDHTRNVIDLVEKFLAYADDLLVRNIITKEQYDQLTQKKIKFLQNVEDGCCFNDEGVSMEKHQDL